MGGRGDMTMGGVKDGGTDRQERNRKKRNIKLGSMKRCRV